VRAANHRRLLVSGGLPSQRRQQLLVDTANDDLGRFPQL
jgi:hypothetical protein